MKRTQIKRKAPKRFWDDARAKMEEEGRCRVCGEIDGLQAAHTVGRAKQDRPLHYHTFDQDGGYSIEPVGSIYVNPDSIVPLCPAHHREHDAHCLELLLFLSLAEQLNAVEAAGGIENARKRLCPSAYPTDSRRLDES